MFQRGRASGLYPGRSNSYVYSPGRTVEEALARLCADFSTLSKRRINAVQWQGTEIGEMGRKLRNLHVKAIRETMV